MSWTLHINNLEGLITDPDREVGYKNYSLSTHFSTRFSNDKACFETNQYIIILDGVVLNSAELKQTYRAESIAHALLAAYVKNNVAFINELRGSFNGALYDKQKNRWILFVNQYGDRPLFYYGNRTEFYVSSDFNLVADYLKLASNSLQPNEKAAYYMLTYGFMIDNSTHIEGIQRLTPGDYICIENAKVSIKPYFRFNNTTTIDISFDEAIDLLDIEFRKAVKRIFDKDIEYGYQTHLADMSGGLDSRMVSWVASGMKYNNISNICYAQSHSAEWRHAMDVANALGNDFMYMPLDKCNFLFEIDKVVSMNYGLSYYAGITGGRRFLERLNSNLFGLEVTGQLGDVAIGTFVHGKPRHIAPNFHKNKYSNRLPYIFDEELLKEFDNLELFSIYKRGFLGALSTHLIRNNHTDVVSPFLDVDFLAFCLSIPLDYRFNHRLYNAWIVRKYPDAARIPTSRYDGSVKENIHWNRAKQLVKLGPGYVVRHLLRICNIELKGSPAKMNPFQYWYVTDDKVRNFIHCYYDENKIRVASGTKLSKDLELMFNKGTVIEKLMVLTVLAVYKRYDLQVR